MKKLGIVTLWVVSVAFIGNSYAEHPTTEQQTVVTAPEVKSPWSVKGFLRTTRTATGKLQDGISNEMFLDVRRSVLEGIVSGLRAGVRVAGSNKFRADLKKTGWEKHYTVFDPAVVVGKPLFDIAGFGGVGELRYFIPLSPDSRLSDRNPSNGSVRAIVAVEKSIGKWTVGAYNFVQRYTFKSEDNVLKQSSNAKYRLANELSLAYQASDTVALTTGVGLEKFWMHMPSDNAGEMEWSTGVELKPVSGLTAGASVFLSAPNQAIAKYLETKESRLQNTGARLDLAYSFL